MKDPLSYAKSGIDIDATDAAKHDLKEFVDRDDDRVVNAMGAFASLVQGRFPEYQHPLLVLKTEEPGSKQKLAFEHNYLSSLALDLINHLVNDVMVMGAIPMYVQDCILCGSIDPVVVKTLVQSMADACNAQGCVLTGGETSVQPGVLKTGQYLLSAFAIGIVERDGVIDGSRIAEDDVVLAVASNGPHTNGYTLIRALLERKPDLIDAPVDGTTFLEAVMRPHQCYFASVKDLFGHAGLKGLAHITGGGIRDNLARVLPSSLDALINLAALEVPEVFRLIRSEGSVVDSDMLRTFNMGVGLIIVASPTAQAEVMECVRSKGCGCYLLGTIAVGSGRVNYGGSIRW